MLKCLRNWSTTNWPYIVALLCSPSSQNRWTTTTTMRGRTLIVWANLMPHLDERFESFVGITKVYFKVKMRQRALFNRIQGPCNSYRFAQIAYNVISLLRRKERTARSEGQICKAKFSFISWFLRKVSWYLSKNIIFVWNLHGLYSFAPKKWILHKTLFSPMQGFCWKDWELLCLH